MITQHLGDAVLGIVAPPERPPVYFDLGGRTIRVTAPPGETLEKLRSFFHPYIASHDATHHADDPYDFAAVCEPELYDYVKANIPETPDHVLSVVLRHDFEYQLRCFYSESREITIIEDEPLKLFYVASGLGRAVKVISTVGSRTQTGLLRLIRSAWMLGRDALIVHGCVMEKHGRGIIVAGEKRAGKSTSLLNLCSRKGYDVIANDRLLLELNRPGERLRAVGVPTVVNLRRETLRPFPELGQLTDAPLFGVYDLAKALGVNIKRETEVTAVVFLSYDRDCREPVFRRLSPDEAYDALSSHLFPPREYDWVRAIKIDGFDPGGVSEPRRDILKGVSCFRLSTNETLLDDSALLLDNWCQR